jgi:phosphatidylserine/phosphatidylglycerophosphate/cardiolipin synthase-like enzyme
MLNEVLSKLGGEKALAELRIMRLARVGTLAMVREGKDYSLRLAKDLAPTVQAAQSGSTGACTSVDVVATVPFSTQRGRASTDGLLTTEEVFAFLLKKAGNYVKLSIPFPEEPIITHYASQFKELAKRKVKVQVLTREVGSMLSSNNTRYVSLYKALARLWDIYKSSGNEHLLEVRDFHRSLGRRGSRFHYESTHAKLVIVDGTDAYSGSGEFRTNSLYNNFELGFMVSGRIVNQVEHAYDLIWDYAMPFSYEAIRKWTNNIAPANELDRDSLSRRRP